MVADFLCGHGHTRLHIVFITALLRFHEREHPRPRSRAVFLVTSFDGRDIEIHHGVLLLPLGRRHRHHQVLPTSHNSPIGPANLLSEGPLTGHGMTGA